MRQLYSSTPSIFNAICILYHHLRRTVNSDGSLGLAQRVLGDALVVANVLGLHLVDVQPHLRLVADVQGVEPEPLGWQEHDAVDVVGVRAGPERDGSRVSFGQTLED